LICWQQLRHFCLWQMICSLNFVGHANFL